jgi:PIN domain nuclease of toxin-antitoxin system
MNLLIDTHLLLWAAGVTGDLPARARRLMEDPGNELYVSAASLWEIGIKTRRGDIDFKVEPGVLRRNLLDNGYKEISITAAHSVLVYSLPLIHKDPFDRILVAQATVEGMTLLTSDSQVAKYPGPIRKV